MSAHSSEHLTIGQVAAQFGITVRTLHHYDRIGLLKPSVRSDSGYRLYTHDDLSRLAQVAGYRRLRMPLDTVRTLLASGPEERLCHLRRHREVVAEEARVLAALIDAIDTTLEAEMTQRPATRTELTEIFGAGFDDAHAEAEARWGDSAAWKESRRRAATYSRSDWETIRREADEITTTMRRAFRAGVASHDDLVTDTAEAHRRHIDRWFYDCDHSVHLRLGDLYTQDARFRETYDADDPGLAAYVREAMIVNAMRHGV